MRKIRQPNPVSSLILTGLPDPGIYGSMEARGVRNPRVFRTEQQSTRATVVVYE
jgi:hypothetical protein